jgi:seryl-tRNA synthetase
LNWSALALSRAMIAIMETHQQTDGHYSVSHDS